MQNYPFDKLRAGNLKFKSRIILAFLLVFFTFASCIFNSSSVFAQATTSGFTLSPPFKEVELKKEASQSSYFIEITNNTSVHQTLHLSVVDFGSLDESGGVAFLGKGEKLERKYGLASWVSLEKDVVEIESGKSQKIKITIVNKESLSPGGHYAAIVASLQSQKEKGENIALNAAFSSLIFVKKIGGEIYRLDLVGKEIRSRWFGLPSKISLRFQNSGNVHLVPRGIITLADPRNTMISKGIINPESGIILPESFRLYHTSLDQLAWPIWPGFYSLHIQYRYAGKEDFASNSSSFFYPGITGLVIIVIILFILTLYFIKRYIKR